MLDAVRSAYPWFTETVYSMPSWNSHSSSLVLCCRPSIEGSTSPSDAGRGGSRGGDGGGCCPRVRLADLVRLHTLRVELNLTLYARQSQLWLHPHLLADLAPTAAWMEELRVQDLNVWLGDGARPRPSLASPRRSCSRLM